MAAGVGVWNIVAAAAINPQPSPHLHSYMYSSSAYFPNPRSYYNSNKTHQLYLCFNHHRSILKVVAAREPKKSNNSDEKWVVKGVITESLPNGMFWVRLENNKDVVLGYVSGKIRRNSIRMLPGDGVNIELTRYDSTRGRIVYRLPSNHS